MGRFGHIKKETCHHEIRVYRASTRADGRIEADDIWSYSCRRHALEEVQCANPLATFLTAADDRLSPVGMVEKGCPFFLQLGLKLKAEPELPLCASVPPLHGPAG